MDWKTGQWEKVGLPYGPKARLIISHLNSEAIRTGTPEINVECSLTAFIRSIQDPTKSGKLGPKGTADTSLCRHDPSSHGGYRACGAGQQSIRGDA